MCNPAVYGLHDLQAGRLVSLKPKDQAAWRPSCNSVGQLKWRELVGRWQSKLTVAGPPVSETSRPFALRETEAVIIPDDGFFVWIAATHIKPVDMSTFPA